MSYLKYLDSKSSYYYSY